MTESEWLACPYASTVFEHGPWSHDEARKLVLLSVALSKAFWERIPEGKHRRAVELAEALSEGQEVLAEMKKLRTALQSELRKTRGQRADRVLLYSLGLTHLTEYGPMGSARGALAVLQEYDLEEPWQADIVRCVRGNPFRPVTFLPDWRTSTVVAIAEGIYQDKAFDRMPILADALRDANCWDEQVLAHCAEPLHTRGCFVIDGLTGRN